MYRRRWRYEGLQASQSSEGSIIALSQDGCVRIRRGKTFRYEQAKSAGKEGGGQGEEWEARCHEFSVEVRFAANFVIAQNVQNKVCATHARVQLYACASSPMYIPRFKFVAFMQLVSANLAVSICNNFVLAKFINY